MCSLDDRNNAKIKMIIQKVFDKRCAIFISREICFVNTSEYKVVPPVSRFYVYTFIF